MESLTSKRFTNNTILDISLFLQFLAMRRRETVCELNVLAQFKKYDVSKLHRGFITPDGIETVLREEGVPADAIQHYIDEFMSLDSNGDGKVSYLDLYESMMTRIPDEWLEWIDTKSDIFHFSFFHYSIS